MEEDSDCWFSLRGWLVIGLLTLLVLWIWNKCRVYNTFTKMGIPGPKPTLLLGNVPDTFKYGLFEQAEVYCRDYGKIYGVFTFTTPVLFIRDAELLKELFVKKFHSFPDRPTQGAINFKPWKDVLTQIKGDHWKHVRSQLSPAFSSGKIKRMMPAVERVTRSLIDHLQKSAEKGELVELKEVCGHFSMDVIAGVAFGIEVDSINNPDDPFVKYAYRIMNPSKFVIALMLLSPKLLWALAKYGLDMGMKASLDFFLSVSQTTKEERKKDDRKYNDFMQLMVEAEREGDKAAVDAEINFKDQLVTSSTWTRKGLTSDEIHANAFVFLLAGYETIATTMSFTLFLLAHHPQCMKKAQEEIDSIAGKKALDYDLANKLNYVEMCICEALRFYTPGFILSREAAEDVDLGGIHITKGMSIMVPTTVIHKDPEFWPDPDKFDPLRHTPEEKAKRHPMAYMPFGMGPRNCIGMRLAQLEVRMGVASVLQHFDVLPCQKSVYPPKLMKARLQAQDGLWVKLQPRS